MFSGARGLKGGGLVAESGSQAVRPSPKERAMIRAVIMNACWAVAAFGAAVFALLMFDVLSPAPWTGWAVTAALPALFGACVIRINDRLRKQGVAERRIPTAKANLARSVFFGFVVGVPMALVAAIVLYLTLQFCCRAVSPGAEPPPRLSGE